MSLTLPSLLSINAERNNSEDIVVDFFQETLIFIGEETLIYDIGFNCFYCHQVMDEVVQLDNIQSHPLQLT